MGIKGLSAFLRKKVKEYQYQLLRARIEEFALTLPEGHPLRDHIYATIVPLKDKDEMLIGIQNVAQMMVLPETLQAAELRRYLIEGLAQVANHDPLHRKMPLESFRGRRIAIDACNWMFIQISTAQRRVIQNTNVLTERVDRNLTVHLWLQKLLDHLVAYLSYGITPVFVFDGAAPYEKTQTKEKRSEKKQQVKHRLGELRSVLTQTDVLDQSEAMIQEYRKLLGQYNYVSEEETGLMRQVLTGLGIPWIQARGEGEKLCSMLAIEGVVAGVLSTDSDNIVYGCPCLITGFDHGAEQTHTVNVIGFQDVLRFLDLSYAAFRDLCIMCGTDYNDNIKNIGPGKAYKLIREWGCIESLPARLDTTILNYPKARELFGYTSSKDLIESGSLDVRLECLAETARDVLTGVKLSHYLPRLTPLYRSLPTPENLPARFPQLIEGRVRLRIVA